MHNVFTGPVPVRTRADRPVLWEFPRRLSASLHIFASKDRNLTGNYDVFFMRLNRSQKLRGISAGNSLQLGFGRNIQRSENGPCLRVSLLALFLSFFFSRRQSFNRRIVGVPSSVNGSSAHGTQLQYKGTSCAESAERN